MTTLMADLVAQQQKGEEPGQHITEKAKQLLAEILLPKQITGKLIEKYIRKAMRTGAWRKLPPQTKALLHTAKKFVVFKSLLIKHILTGLLIKIELYTIRGKALYNGLIKVMMTFSDLNTRILDIEKLLVIGLSYLNASLIYRVNLISKK